MLLCQCWLCDYKGWHEEEELLSFLRMLNPVDSYLVTYIHVILFLNQTLLHYCLFPPHCVIANRVQFTFSLSFSWFIILNFACASMADNRRERVETSFLTTINFFLFYEFYVMSSENSNVLFLSIQIWQKTHES